MTGAAARSDRAGRASLNADLAGKDYGTSTYEVTAEAIERYARATNDLNDRYLGEDVVASPVFPMLPAFAAVMNAATDPELGADLLRLVHGSQEHLLRAPIRPGDTLSVHSVLESVERHTTGETFTVRATETNQHGDVAAEVAGTMFIRGPVRAGGRATPPPRSRRGRSSTSRRPSSTTTRRNATRRRRAIAIRSTWTRPSPAAPGCAAPSSTGCARWPSPPRRRSTGLPAATRRR